MISAIGADVDDDVEGPMVDVEVLVVVDEIEPEPKVHAISGVVTNSCHMGSVSVRAKFLPLCKA